MNEVYEDAKKGSKKLDFGENTKFYTPILNFYECETNFEAKPLNQIKFKCIICKKTFHARVGRCGNLNRHINIDHTDQKTTEWCEKFKNYSKKSKTTTILDEDNLLLVKYFISSNNSIAELKNKFFKKLMAKAKMKTSDYRTFVNSLLPKVMQEIHEIILSKAYLSHFNKFNN